MSFRTNPWVSYKCSFCPLTDEQERLEMVKFATPIEESPISLKEYKLWRYRHVCVNCGAKAKAITDVWLGVKK